MKRLLALLVVVSIVAVWISACTGMTNTATGPNPVHMDSNSFEKISITIKKGEKVTLINDVIDEHVISNGTWDDSTPRPKVEPGAPKTDIDISGNSAGSVGPFNTAGTFQIYCTVHPGMKMSIVVK
jgi:plastocyanin